MIEKIKSPKTEKEVISILNPLVKEWFFTRFKEFSLPQLYAVTEVHKRNNILISAPTGGTKTLTAFLSILNELVNLSVENKLEDHVYAVYISPLKSLNNDISFNLQQPLKEIKELAKKYNKKINIRVAVRTGDTTASEKAKMLKNPPHILITTPESLAIMQSSYKFVEKLEKIEWCVIDEIHALAENKRGVHLSLSLERLEYLRNICRVGLSATVSPIEEMASFLVGERDCKIAEISFDKKFDLKVISPVNDLINITQEKLHDAMYKELDRLIQGHKTTLIFTNTRSGTERIVHHLKEKFPKSYTENIGAHHGSLSKTHRIEIEERLRKGELKAVVCSTSLELGIDIGYIDLVICIGSPKSVARLLQRCLPYDSRILLADGTYKKIGDIVENKLNVEVLCFDEKRKVFVKSRIKDYHKNKSKKLLRISLHSGLEQEFTEEHPLYTKEGWKKAKNIKEGEEIAEIFNYKAGNAPYIYELLDKKIFYIENKGDFFRKTIRKYITKNKITYTKFSDMLNISSNRLQDYIRENGRRKSIRLDIFIKAMGICNIKKSVYLNHLKGIKTRGNHREEIPLKLNKDIMWLAGIVASDGSITYHKSKRYYHIKIGNKDRLLLEECKRIYNKYGFNVNLRFDKKRNFYNLDCGSRLLSELFIKFGIIQGKKSFSINVSNELYKLPKELLIPYIEGVLEGDGNISQGRIRIFTASKKFAIGIHNLLNKCGIHNYFSEQQAKTSKKVNRINSHKIYCLIISRNKHIKNFIDYCTFKGKKVKELSKKQPKYFIKELDVEKNINWVKVMSIKEIDKESYVYNITLERNPNTYIVESIFTHNCGRAGHELHGKIKGRIVVLDRDDLVECSVLLKDAIEKKIDRIHIPKNCLDVLAQQVYGAAIANVWSVNQLYKLFKRSYCYKDLKESDFLEIIRYLNGEYSYLEDRHVYSKIWYEDGKIGKRGKLARMIYMTNLGTIPEETSVRVKIGDQVIGTIDETFLERLKRKDIFILGGDTYEFSYSRGMTAQVKSSSGSLPTVPSWFSESLPLSFDLALDIGRFRRLMLEHLGKKSKKEILDFINEYLYVDEKASLAIYNYFNQQYLYSKTIPNDKNLVLEHYSDEDKKYAIFHSLYGRRVNDVLARATAYASYRINGRDVEIGISDNGFFLASKKNIQALNALKLLKHDELEEVMKRAIKDSEIFKRRFRHCATRAMMILRTYKGKRKNVGRQQVSSSILLNAVRRISDEFSILKEARREVLEDLMDLNNAKKIVKEINEGKIKVKEINNQIPTPFAFNLVLQGHLDVIRMEDRIEFLRRMNDMVLAKIGKNEDFR